MMEPDSYLRLENMCISVAVRYTACFDKGHDAVSLFSTYTCKFECAFGIFCLSSKYKLQKEQQLQYHFERKNEK